MIVSHPHSNDSVKVLADAFLKEQKSEIAELSAIRYAQGEVYFHHKDYETAIFKWEKVDGELELWSKKNIADAYYELGLLANAKNVYRSIQTDSLTLKTEVSLQLFFNLHRRGKA